MKHHYAILILRIFKMLFTLLIIQWIWWLHYSLYLHITDHVLSRVLLVYAVGLQRSSLRENQRGQMADFAVQPHLINNIIVLLHTTIKATPPPFHFPPLFFLFQDLAACCPVAWLRRSHAATGTEHQSKARHEPHHSLLSDGNKHTYIQI